MPISAFGILTIAIGLIAFVCLVATFDGEQVEATTVAEAAETNSL